MVREWILLLAALVVCQRVIELFIARRNRRMALALGAREYGAAHYYCFFLLHGAWLIGWLTESCVTGWQFSATWYLWASLFVMGQFLRYWCMVSLGDRWNTRILVVPNARPIRKGPYRWIKHPNYLAVVLELLSIPMLCNAIFAATFFSIINACFLFKVRIPAEERAVYGENTN